MADNRKLWNYGQTPSTPKLVSGSPYGVGSGKPVTQERITALDALLGINQFVPVTGDIQSGILAAQDVKKGDYGSAALNAVGLLPWIPALGGTFIGKGSKVWDAVKADEAIKLEKAGMSPEEIWRKTGTVRAPDGKWRQEISDEEARILLKPTLSVLKQNKSLPSIMQHPTLYNAYDDLSSLSVKPSFDSLGYYSANENAIGLAPINESANWRMNMYKDSKKKTLLHEGQHAIQEKEGFAKGGSAQEFINDFIEKKADANQSIAELNSQMADVVRMMDVAKQNKFSDTSFDKRISALQNKYDDLMSKRNLMVKDAQIDPREQAHNQYKRLFGEAESRLTESRMNLTPQERLQYFPYSQGQYGLDVPFNELVIRGLLD